MIAAAAIALASILVAIGPVGELAGWVKAWLVGFRERLLGAAWVIV